MGLGMLRRTAKNGQILGQIGRLNADFFSKRMIGGNANDKPVSLDEFDSQTLVCYRQTYDSCVQMIVDQFMKKRSGVVAGSLIFDAGHELSLQLSGFFADLFIDKRRASDPKRLGFASLDGFQGCDCLITRFQQVSENDWKCLTRSCDFDSASFRSTVELQFVMLLEVSSLSAQRRLWRSSMPQQPPSVHCAPQWQGDIEDGGTQHSRPSRVSPYNKAFQGILQLLKRLDVGKNFFCCISISLYC